MAYQRVPQSPTTPPDPTAATFELEHWHRPQRGKPETVWCRLQFVDRAAAEERIAYLTRVAEAEERPPPGMARPTRLRLLERRELADVRPRIPGQPAEPPMVETSMSWRTWRGPAVPGGPPAERPPRTNDLALDDDPDAEGVA